MCIINEAPEIRFHRTTTLTAEQFVAGLTDFGRGRSKLFGNSAHEYLKVHYLGQSQADITKGSRGTWERLYYDWSDPNYIVLTTTDSNVRGGPLCTPTPFCASLTAQTKLTSSLYEKARTSKDGCSVSS